MGLLNQGLILLGTGMVAVFAFLVLLVWAMNQSAKLAPKLSHMLPDPEPVGVGDGKNNDRAGDVDVGIAVAIAAAMRKARK